jgi:hypothetical protein
MFKTTIFDRLGKVCLSISLLTMSLGAMAQGTDNNANCAGILATIPGGNLEVSVNGPTTGEYTGNFTSGPIAVLTINSSFVPTNFPFSPEFKLVLNGTVTSFNPINNGLVEIQQLALNVGTNNYAVVIAQFETATYGYCYKTTTGINITVTQAPCQAITTVLGMPTMGNSITLVGDAMVNNYSETIYPQVDGNFVEVITIKNGVEIGNYQSFSFGVQAEVSFSDGDGIKSFAYKFRNSCSTITSDVFNINVTTIASLPCLPITFVGSDAVATIPGLFDNNQLQAQFTTNTTFSGNYLGYTWELNGTPFMQPMPSPSISVDSYSNNLNIGANIYTVTVSSTNGGSCAGSVTPLVQSFSVDVITVTSLPCTAAPTIYEFGFYNQTTSGYEYSKEMSQCSGGGGFSYNVGVDGNGQLGEDVYFNFYSNGDFIATAPNTQNFFNVPNSVAGVFQYSMEAINNCGTTTSTNMITLTITSNPNGCNQGGGGGSGTGTGQNCDKPTVVGMNITSINTTIFGTVMYSVSASNNTGSISGYVWYKALPGVTPPLTNQNQVTTIFGSSNTLTLLYATADDAGYYAVSAMNSCGRESEPHFFDISVNTVVATGFVPTLPAVEIKLLGGDFATSFTTPGFITPVDEDGTFDLNWEDVVGVNTANGDSYCILISLTPDFSKSKEICGLTSSGVSFTAEELNAFLSSLARKEATQDDKQIYYYKVAPVIQGFKAEYSAPAQKAYQNSNLVVLNITDSNDSEETISLYPNPNDGSFTILAKGNVVISNIQGIVLKSIVSNGQHDVSGLYAGLYIVNINGKNYKVVVK